jgi:hypothetical protein
LSRPTLSRRPASSSEQMGCGVPAAECRPKRRRRVSLSNWVSIKMG